MTGSGSGGGVGDGSNTLVESDGVESEVPYRRSTDRRNGHAGDAARVDEVHETVAGVEVRRDIGQRLIGDQARPVEGIDRIRLIEDFAVEQREAHLGRRKCRVDRDREFLS
jgi:hypothetical protein